MSEQRLNVQRVPEGTSIGWLTTHAIASAYSWIDDLTSWRPDFVKPSRNRRGSPNYDYI